MRCQYETPSSLIASLGAVYLAMWLVGPSMTDENVVAFGLIGVLAWPLLAGTVLVLFRGPRCGRAGGRRCGCSSAPGRPPPVMLIRAHHARRFDGVIAGVEILIPVAVWRWIRTRRRPRLGV
jgi:hypothetical protein